MEDNWSQRFLALATLISTWSKDPSTKVGSVIVKDKRILSHGYNGFPRGVSDDHRLLDRVTKYQIVVHAEVNAILNARVPVAGATLYSTFFPCPQCAAAIIQAGIKAVVSVRNPSDDRHRDAISLSQKILTEAGVQWQYLL